MTDPVVSADTTASDFQNRRTLLAQSTALEELLQRAGTPASAAKAASKPASAGGATVPATDPTQDVVSDTTLKELVIGRRPQSLPVRMAKDVGAGIIESPRAVVKGARDAFQNTVDLAAEVGDWTEKTLHLPVVMIDGQGLSIVSNEEAKGRRLADYAKLPDIGAPKSVTGGMIKGITQFLVGMKGAGKLLDVAGVPQQAGAAGYAIASLKGAISNFAVFDPHQQRLSNLIQEFPALRNPVTEFLASDPTDNAAEGRFKNSLEGFGLGVITDGFFKGVRLLRSTLVARKGAEAGVTALKPEEASDEIAKLLTPEPPEGGLPPGTPPAGPPLIVKPRSNDALDRLNAAALRTAQVTPDDVVGRMVAPLDAVASSAEGRAGEPAKTFINFAHVDTPEDVQKVMQGLADKVPLEPDAARAGVRSFADMKLDAAHTNAWESLMSRAQGEPLSDAKMLAARQLWATSADKLGQLAQEAATAPSEANLFAFRKMLATHSMIQNEVLGARAAIARAQGSMRIPVGSSAERLRDMQHSLELGGGSDVARELARAIDGMAKAGLISEIAEAAEKGAGARTIDAAKEAWTLGLLTSPKTHLRNILSNTMFAPMQMAERYTAGKFGEFLGDETGVQAGEASAQYFGAAQGVKDMFRYYGKMMQARITGTADDVTRVASENPIAETGIRDANKIDLPPAISSDALKLDPDSWLGKGADTLGSVYGITSKALTAEDDFFKVMGYRMETYAQAMRQTRQEIAAGAIPEDQAAERMAQLIASPSENIRMASVDQALYQTFNQAPGWFGQLLLKAKRNSLVAHILIPFARTTANLQRAAFERTPLAPIVGQWRADFMAGGARQQLAVARWSLGSMATFAVIDATMSGQITGRGPVDPGQREAMSREGWKPYSMKVGDRWVQYNGISPMGDTIGMAADAAEMAMHGSNELVEGKDMERVTLAAIAATAGNVMNKSYLSGFSSVIEAINDPTGSSAQWARQMAGSIVPSGVNVVTKAMDPNVREVNSMMDAIRARIPGMSDELPLRRDLWGEPLRNDSGFGKPFDALSPVYSQKPTPEPIDQEIIRQGLNVEMPSPNTSFDGVSVDLRKYPKAYDRYTELAGNELKHPGWRLGAKDLLNAVVKGDHPLSAVYRMRSDGPDGGKDVFIRDTVRQYRELARRQVLKEFPDLAAEVREKQAKQRSLRMPVVG